MGLPVYFRWLRTRWQPPPLSKDEPFLFDWRDVLVHNILFIRPRSWSFSICSGRRSCCNKPIWRSNFVFSLSFVYEFQCVASVGWTVSKITWDRSRSHRARSKEKGEFDYNFFGLRCSRVLLGVLIMPLIEFIMRDGWEQLKCVIFSRRQCF